MSGGEVAFRSTYHIPANPEKEGFTFRGWNSEKGELASAFTAAELPEDQDVYAQFEENSYTIVFSANGGGGHMPVQELRYTEKARLRKNAFTRKGYRFAGWITEPGDVWADGRAIEKETAEPYGIIQLTAKWEPEAYGITFEPNGGNGDAFRQEYTYGNGTGLSPSPFTREGYRFAGWNTKADGTGAAYQNCEDADRLGRDAVLYAQWEASYSEATSSEDGLMSKSDKAKLDGVAAGATKVAIANNLTTAAAGKALDATQGKALKDAMDGLKEEIAGMLYPVGSYYFSDRVTDPSELFGGTWERVEGRFLWAAGDAEIGKTGGERTHTLTVAEMPSHSHTLHGWWSCMRNGGDRHVLAKDEVPSDQSTNSAGGSQPHNNMPPYIGVYCWKRTA